MIAILNSYIILQKGIVVIGGLFFSLALTLFVIPAMYTFFSKEKKEEG